MSYLILPHLISSYLNLSSCLICIRDRCRMNTDWMNGYRSNKWRACNKESWLSYQSHFTDSKFAINCPTENKVTLTNASRGSWLNDDLSNYRLTENIFVKDDQHFFRQMTDIAHTSYRHAKNIIAQEVHMKCEFLK